MDETLITPHAAWRRQNATHHYAGSIEGSEDGLRLAGRDPATGIQVTLVIPAAEIREVRVARGWDERVVGERCVVLDLVDSTPILVREVGASDPHDLARRLNRTRAARVRAHSGRAQRASTAAASA
jgi:hypothetical protein